MSFDLLQFVRHKSLDPFAIPQPALNNFFVADYPLLTVLVQACVLNNKFWKVVVRKVS
jgi:hypothetical protein